MNKLVMPALLVSITLVTGIFAFMPVEKVSTVHTTIATNINDQNRAMTFAVNMTDTNGEIQLIPGEAGITFTGSYVISAIPSNGSGTGAAGNLECGLTDGNANSLGVNGSETGAVSAALGAALGVAEGIFIQVDNEDADPGNGVCQVTVVLDSAGG